MKSIILSIILSIFFIKFSFGISDEEYQEISFLIEQNNIEKSFELLKEVQSSEKKLSPKSRILFGKFYIELERPAKALEYFKSVTFASTQLDAEANAGMAKAEFMLGNIEASEKFSKEALKINPDLVDGKVILAQVLSEQNYYKKAEVLFLSAMKASRKNTYPGRKFAETLLRQNKLDDAENILKKTVIQNFEDGPSLELFSDIYWLRGDIEQAILFRTQAEENYRSSGNIIKADQMVAWLNFEAVPIAEEKAQKKVEEEAQKKVEEEAQKKVEENTANKTILRPKRKVFEPRVKPEEILVDTRKEIVSGTGVILNSGNWILTNKHVIENLEYVVVRNGLGEIRYVDEIRESISDDLALLTLSEPYPAEYSLNVNDFKIGDTGATIYVIGYPMSSIFGSFHPTITEGIISNPLGFGERYGEFQITAKVNPGNSGGPIFDKYGKIVGIVTGKVDSEKVLENEGFMPEDINYAVKTDRVLSFLKQPINASLGNAYEYDPASLYKHMRSAIVLVVGQE